MDERTSARARAAEGWRYLRAFFQEGCRRLPEAAAALWEAEQSQRRAGDQEELMVTLLGLSVALRLGRDPAETERAVTLAQEVVNAARRLYGEAVALSYRAYLEAAYKDLADVTKGDARERATKAGIAACDRTVRLAGRLRVPQVVPASRAARAALLLHAAASRPADAARLSRQAGRLYTAALGAWPSRDPEGRAAVQIEMVEKLLPYFGSRLDADRLLLDAVRALEQTGNRYLLAAAARAQARVALAWGRADALDRLEAAMALFRALGCEREAREVEALL
jgi:hypothetical protein